MRAVDVAAGAKVDAAVGAAPDKSGSVSSNMAVILTVLLSIKSGS
jgi:hypothetical protein